MQKYFSLYISPSAFLNRRCLFLSPIHNWHKPITTFSSMQLIPTIIHHKLTYMLLLHMYTHLLHMFKKCISQLSLFTTHHTFSACMEGFHILNRYVSYCSIACWHRGLVIIAIICNNIISIFSFFQYNYLMAFINYLCMVR